MELALMLVISLVPDGTLLGALTAKGDMSDRLSVAIVDTEPIQI
jgi:hypothetical protein